ncbi:MAG: helix-turn-helix domain-containing protein [Pseudonocardia sp.]|nr:helix-turn-helix domain-containing protein [Pseudonocardia sp.]
MHRRQGQDLTALLAAYRIGASVAWRHVTEAATQVGVGVELFPELAGAVFAAVDQLSSASLRGFLAEQCDTAATRDRHRAELAELLVSDRCDSDSVRAAAQRAEWALPQRAGVVLVDPDNEVARRQLARLGEACLWVRRRDALIAIVADPSGPGQRPRLGNLLGGTSAVVGESVALDELPASLRRAEVAARLRRAGRLRAGRDPLFVAEHLAGLIVHQDENLLASLRRAYLAPLASLPRSTRERLEPTLLCWLEHMGNQKTIAAQLHVHPQTVRYRLGQLRELFGPGLDDPDTRAALLVALAWGGPANTEPATPHGPGPGPEPGLLPAPRTGSGPRPE